MANIVLAVVVVVLKAVVLVKSVSAVGQSARWLCHGVGSAERIHTSECVLEMWVREDSIMSVVRDDEGWKGLFIDFLAKEKMASHNKAERGCWLVIMISMSVRACEGGGRCVVSL